MSLDLGSLLQNQLGGVLSQFLTSTGESAENSTKAAGLAIPAVVAGLLKNISSNNENASSLFNLVSGAAGQQLDGAVAQAATGSEGLIEMGKNLLPNLLGGNAADVADAVAQESGVSKVAAGSAIALALPLVLSVLRGQKMEFGQLLGSLASQQSWLSKMLPASLLSALGIGSVSGLTGNIAGLASGLGNFGSSAAAAVTGAAGAAGAAVSGVAGAAGSAVKGAGAAVTGAAGAAGSAVKGAGAAVTGAAGAAGSAAAAGAAALTAKKSGFGKWIALGLAALLALFAFKSCSGSKDAAAPTAAVSASDASAASGADMAASADGMAASADASAASATASASTDVNASAAASGAASASASDAANAAAATAPAGDAARVVVENGVAKFFFATGKNNVAEGAETVVADVIKLGKEGKKLVVSGYADSTGNAAQNEELSKKRAQAVKAFFEAQGVPAANIELRKPESTTGAQGNDVEGRRVEVKIEG
ncbi:MAG: OmpA family protein [Neisseria sp.]|nr:OmpA family protein [Neisseria sp.]